MNKTQTVLVSSISKNQKGDAMLALIGSTPIMRIRKLNPNNDVTIWAKLEGFNPGGSAKDRVAKEMIERAEEQGILNKHKTIIEATSGNTGIGLALVSAIKGYKLKIVASKSISPLKKRILEAYGAELILTDCNQGTDGARRKVEEIISENPEKYYHPNQFDNPANSEAHYKTTALEILNQLEEKIDYFVAGIGTTGTLMGVSKRLKENNPKIRIIGVEPIGSNTIPGLKNLRLSRTPKIFSPSSMDEVYRVKRKNAEVMQEELAKKEGILAGISSGAILHAAITLASRIKKGRIVVLFPDRGERYLN
jgi:cysteine synthase